MLFTDALAAISGRIDLVISLSGALTVSLLGLVVPASLDLLAHQKSAIKVVKNWFLIILGVLGFTVGTLVSVTEIITSINKTSN